MRKIKKFAAVVTTAAVVAAIPASAGWTKMDDADELRKRLGVSSGYELSDDFFDDESFGFDEDFLARMEGGLDGADARYEFALELEEYADEFDAADAKYKDASTYVASYDETNPRGVTAHAAVADPATRIVATGDGKMLAFLKEDGTPALEIELTGEVGATPDGESTGSTLGTELCVWNDGFASTPGAGESGADMAEAGITAVFPGQGEIDLTDAIAIVAEEKAREEQAKADALEKAAFEVANEALVEDQTEAETDAPEDASTSDGMSKTSEFDLDLFGPKEGEGDEPSERVEDATEPSLDDVESGAESESPEVDADERLLKGAIGVAGAGDFYLFVAESPTPESVVARTMARLGCTYACAVDAAKVVIDGDVRYPLD